MAEEIVLYHGSLAELNSRSDKKYTFAREKNFFYEIDSGNLDDKLMKELKAKGYVGLVNMRTTLRSVLLFFPLAFFEGTPIIPTEPKSREISDASEEPWPKQNW